MVVGSGEVGGGGVYHVFRIKSLGAGIYVYCRCIYIQYIYIRMCEHIAAIVWVRDTTS